MDIQLTSGLNSSMATTSSPVVYTPMAMDLKCRDRRGSFPVAFYNMVTCAFCFTYVYTDINVSIVMPDSSTVELMTGTNMGHPEGTSMSVDLDNATAVDVVCSSLKKPSQCWKWQSCCRHARRCCQRQLAEGPRPYQEYDKTICPRTWDGFGCWSDTPAGTRPSINCPAYVTPDADTDEYAYKKCTENGTWHGTLYEGGLVEWTDYTHCNNRKQSRRLNDAGLACNTVTILLIVPACIIFLYFKPLRQQNRIRLHLCLMVSSFVTSVSMLLWEVIMYRDLLESTDSESTLHQNSVGCRMLYMLTRYTTMASFMWMFIEGFYLHRLLVHAFSVPKTLIPYYVFGFGFPVLPVTVYAIIRGTSEDLDQRCWIYQAGAFEWIIYAPILAALTINLFFLGRILFIMVRQLESHPNEPSNFRRALKAVGVLVPLFGIQFVLFAYRPGGEGTAQQVLGLLSKISEGLQGAFIAIIFCFCNKEVQGYLKSTRCIRKLRRPGLRHEFNNSRSHTMTTQFATDMSRTKTTNENGDSSHMIPLRPIYCPKNGDEANSNSKDRNADSMNGNLHTIPEFLDEELPLNPAKHTT